jgi:bifunctional glutamyl/prolyl-tRNA synthetase
VNVLKLQLVQAPYCGSCEDQIKKDSAKHDDASEVGQALMGAKALCIPFDQPAKVSGELKCINPKCSDNAKCYTLFGRSY